MLSRRIFVRGSAIVMAGMGSAPGWLARAAEGSGERKKILIALFQRGAADGLNIVVPFAEKRYAQLRPTIGIAAPGSPNGAIDLDGHFGLHPALTTLKPLWDKKQLAIVHAAGSPDPSRSHFDAQDYMESGSTGKALSDGWLNRALPAVELGTSPVRAIALNAQVPRTLRGDRPAIAINGQQFQLGNQNATSVLESLYGATADTRLGASGKDAFAALKIIRNLNQQGQQFNNAYAQAGELGRNLQQIARLIKANVGVEAAFAELDGWDHHTNEQPQLDQMLRQFGAALSAFYTDMGDRMEDIAIVTMSEFGRTAEENGTGGTDHGHGNVMMVLGGQVSGGKVYGQWPGLEREQLNEGRDLAVTTDFRTVLSELIHTQLGQDDFTRVFPGYQPAPPLGLVRSEV